jgi:hypothetical protein
MIFDISETIDMDVEWELYFYLIFNNRNGLFADLIASEKGFKQFHLNRSRK